MIKYKVSKQQSFFGRSKQEDYKTYYTSTKTIKVKDLPSHPLKDQVSVGVYKLNEKIDRTSLLTGESFQYEFKIEGEGNISSLHKPDINVSDNFEFYPPNTLQNIQKSYGKVMGSKVYSYYGIPKEPGEFALGDYVSWIYFNTSKEAYDTLMPNIKLIIKGESKRNQAITSNDLGSFYDMIDHEDNELGYINENDTLNILGNIIVLALFSFTCILWYRSKKRYE